MLYICFRFRYIIIHNLLNFSLKNWDEIIKMIVYDCSVLDGRIRESIKELCVVNLFFARDEFDFMALFVDSEKSPVFFDREKRYRKDS